MCLLDTIVRYQLYLSGGGRGRDGYVYLRFCKIGWIKIRYHHSLPEYASIKEATFKKEVTGERVVSFSSKTDDDTFQKKPRWTVQREQQCGIDSGILNYVHTFDGQQNRTQFLRRRRTFSNAAFLN